MEFTGPLIREYTRDPLILRARGGPAGVFQPASSEDRMVDNLMISMNSYGPVPVEAAMSRFAYKSFAARGVLSPNESASVH